MQAFNDEPAGAPLWPSLGAFRLSAVGVALSLSVFMADAIRAAGASRRSFRDPLKSIQEMRPVTFNWPLFLAACVLMELPAVALVRQYFARR